MIQQHLDAISKVPLTLVEIEGKGRGIKYTPKDSTILPAGTILLRQPIIGMVLDSEENCLECLIPMKERIGCCDCRIGKYCSRKCFGINFYKSHQLKCSINQKVFQPDDKMVKLILELILMEQCTLINETYKNNPKAKGDLDIQSYFKLNIHDDIKKQLQIFHSLTYNSNNIDRQDDFICETVMCILERMHNSLESFIDKKIKPYDKERIMQILLKIKNNSFELTYNRKSIGDGNLPIASLLNHSCYQNCGIKLEFTNTIYTAGSYYLITIDDILPGQELTLSYIDGILDKQSRKIKLNNKYGFECQCIKCENVIEDVCLQRGNINFENFKKVVDELSLKEDIQLILCNYFIYSKQMNMMKNIGDYFEQVYSIFEDMLYAFNIHSLKQVLFREVDMNILGNYVLDPNTMQLIEDSNIVPKDIISYQYLDPNTLLRHIIDLKLYNKVYPPHHIMTIEKHHILVEYYFGLFDKMKSIEGMELFLAFLCFVHLFHLFQSAGLDPNGIIGDKVSISNQRRLLWYDKDTDLVRYLNILNECFTKVNPVMTQIR